MKHASIMLLSAAALAAAAATGCKQTLGPGEEWYTYHNTANNFVRLEIDGKITGATYRPDESRNIPLATGSPHTIIASHGSNTLVFDGVGDFVMRYAVESVDPPYTIVWSPPEGWTVAPRPPSRP